MALDYSVKRSPNAVAALQRLPKSLQATAETLALRLGALVSTHPERLYETVSGFVYQHPDPLIEIGFAEAGKRAYVVTEFRAPLPPSVLVFISYSHNDDKFRAELCKYLGRLHESGQVSFWHDKKDLVLNSEWRKEICSAIKRSSAALLIVTQDFIDSKFIRDTELPLVQAKLESPPFEVFWIPVDASTIDLDIPWICERQHFDIQKPLSRFSKPLRKDKLTSICKQFRLHLETLSAASVSTKGTS